MNMIHLQYPGGRLRGTIRLPLSKSILNRVLILAHLSDQAVELPATGQADDVVRMAALLRIIREQKSLKDAGVCTLDCGNAGTVLRFLAPVCAMEPGTWLLTGSRRMQERPVGPLVEALTKTGARIRYAAKEGYPPLRIEGGNWQGGDAGIIPGNISSQFLSALLMAGPFGSGIRFQTYGTLSSRPYLDMTLSLLRNAGYRAEEPASGEFRVFPGDPHTRPDWHLMYEPDWSGASYFYAMAALAPEAELMLEGLHESGLQGDAVTAGFFKDLGVESLDTAAGIVIRKTKNAEITAHFETHLRAFPDLAMTLAVCCAGLGIPARLGGLESLRIKESDRLLALQTELNKQGFYADIEQDSLILDPARNAAKPDSIPVETWQDHRIAMAFAPLALRFREIHLVNPEVVDKSFPLFWEQCQKIGFICG